MDSDTHDRYAAEIVRQTDLLRSAIRDADMTVPVPSCPGWNVGQLVRHLGGGQRWAADVVRAQGGEPVSDDHFRDLSPYANEDPAVLDPWLADGAAALAATLIEFGPDSPMDTGPIPDGTASFFSRRFANETLMHRADAVLALGQDFVADTAVAIDAIDEWMWLGALPMHFEFHPPMRELLAPGRTIHLHATDTDDPAAEWVVDLTGDVISWRHAHEKSAVAVRGPVSELLLTIYKRRPVAQAGIDVIGDAELLDFWLERVDFG